MFGFLIKKAFFDMWDNFLGVVLLNLGFVALLAIPILVPGALVEVSVPLSLASLVIGVTLLFMYAGVTAFYMRDISDYQRPVFANFIPYLKETWKASLVYALIYGVLAVVFWYSVPVYLGFGTLLSLAALMFIFWAAVMWVAASQFYYPIRARLDQKIGKVLKKSFIIFFDNTIFAIFSLLFFLAIMVLSTFTAFLLPGFAGAMLWLQVGFKLRLYKYDYLEENPDADRKKIPWGALLMDDKERVGKRTLRGMIFPWKE